MNERNAIRIEGFDDLFLRTAVDADRDGVWRALEPVIRAGRTYALPPDMPRDAALAYWWMNDALVSVACDDGDVAGSYFLRPAQAGGGSHVANCGFVVAPALEGGGIGRALLSDAIASARDLGYLAMQFNFVISTNRRAVALWRSAGFVTVGVLPLAFRLPDSVLTDVYVMHLDLTQW